MNQLFFGDDVSRKTMGTVTSSLPLLLWNKLHGDGVTVYTIHCAHMYQVPDASMYV